MKIINIPIEPIEMRYSADWYRWFEDELRTRKLDYWTIHDSMWMLRKDIKEGAFLDVVGTNYYKSKQIEFICQLIDQGFIPRNERVVFLLHDGWFPVEQLAYMRDMLGCHEWKIVGIFHAGTYDKWDQTAQHGMATWGEDLENSWFKIYDKVIVASHYHRDLILRYRKIDSSRIHIIPWKVEVPQDLVETKKEYTIIFPHRDNPEKQPDLFEQLEVPSGWTKLTTKDAAKTKREYYELLAKSKISISFALQETFGIAMAESVQLGCIPLVPDRLSYKDIYPDEFRYIGEEDFKQKLHLICSSEQRTKMLQPSLKILQEWFRCANQNFVPAIIEIMETL